MIVPNLTNSRLGEKTCEMHVCVDEKPKNTPSTPCQFDVQPIQLPKPPKVGTFPSVSTNKKTKLEGYRVSDSTTYEREIEFIFQDVLMNMSLAVIILSNHQLEKVTIGPNFTYEVTDVFVIIKPTKPMTRVTLPLRLKFYNPSKGFKFMTSLVNR